MSSYYGKYSLLSVNADAKTSKGNGAGTGFLTGIMYLAPASSSGRNVCKDATPGCIAACLNTAGRGAFSNVQAARMRKTRLFFEDRTAFLRMLAADIRTLERHATRRGLRPVVRLNGTSDLPWERMHFSKVNGCWINVMTAFPDVQFYDYTKSEARAIEAATSRTWPRNYDLTFSRSESNDATCERVLAAGGRVAIVYGPRMWTEFALLANAASYGAQGYVDGDRNDLRHVDPRAVIVALKAKGKAKADKSGFVLN